MAVVPCGDGVGEKEEISNRHGKRKERRGNGFLERGG